jgi:hypothetical protein
MIEGVASEKFRHALANRGVRTQGTCFSGAVKWSAQWHGNPQCIATLAGLGFTRTAFVDRMENTPPDSWYEKECRWFFVGASLGILFFIGLIVN